jgi:hypothetical protein
MLCQPGCRMNARPVCGLLTSSQTCDAQPPQQLSRQLANAVDGATAAELGQQGDDPDVPPSDPDDGNSSPYYSDSSIDSNTLAGAQRTVPFISGSSDARMLAVSADKRQGVWTVRYRRGNQRKWRWMFLGLRFVRFSDGERLVGFSNGCPCPSSDSSRLRAQLDCCDRPANPVT